MSLLQSGILSDEDKGSRCLKSQGAKQKFVLWLVEGWHAKKKNCGSHFIGFLKRHNKRVCK